MKESALPTGFESFQLDGSSGTFSYENMKNQNKELVLISAPSEFDINKLKGEQIVLHGSKILPGNQPESETLTSKWELHSFLASSDRHLNILLPSDSQHKHVMSDPLSVTLNVVRNMQIPILKSPEKKKATRMPKPAGLKPRWVPFGSGDSNKCKDMENMNHMDHDLKTETKKKKIIENEEDSKLDLGNLDHRIDETVMVENVSKRKKKKKKKGNQQDGDDNVMTAVKEKQNDISCNIKVESMEVESVASEDREQKKKKKKKHDDKEVVSGVPETDLKNDIQLPDTEKCDETGKEHKKKKKKKFTEVQEKENFIKQEDCLQKETSETKIAEHNQQESNLNIPQISETNEHGEKKKKKKKKRKKNENLEQIDAEVNGHFEVKPEVAIKEEVKSQENVSNVEGQEKKKKKKKKQEQVVEQRDTEVNGLFNGKSEDALKEIKSQENMNHVEEQEKKKKKKKRKSDVTGDATSNEPIPPVVKTEDVEKTIEANENDQKHKRKRKKRKSLANGQDVDIKPNISELNLNNTTALNSVVVGNTDSSKKRNKKRKRESMTANSNEIKKIRMDSNNNSSSGAKKSVSYSSDLNSDAEDKLLGVVPKKRAFSN